MGTWTTIAAIAAVAGITLFALSRGIDSALTATAFTIIGGLGGYQIARRSMKTKRRR